MALYIEDKWIWDFWFAQDGEDTHIFYLRADKSLGDPEQRHWNVTIGHAVSTDLINWNILPDAIAPTTEWEGEEPFDSKTTWTGCVIRHRNEWIMFYTSSKKSESGLKQRIVRAVSHDMISWKKCIDKPAFSADPQWYELLGGGDWHDESWRDPWVFLAEEDAQWHMYFTAREKTGPSDGRGVVAHATSNDLVHWQAQAPLAAPGWYGEMEVPQVFEQEGRYYLIYSVPRQHITQKHLRETNVEAQTGTFYMVSESPLGPFKHVTTAPWIGDSQQSSYAARVLTRSDGKNYVFVFHNLDKDGTFIGAVSDPYLVETDLNGNLLPISSQMDR